MAQINELYVLPLSRPGSVTIRRGKVYQLVLALGGLDATAARIAGAASEIGRWYQRYAVDPQLQFTSETDGDSAQLVFEFQSA